MTEDHAGTPGSVLIVRSAFGELYELAWVRALHELATQVELFDTHSFIPANLAGRLEERYLAGPHVSKVNRLVVERVREMRPDVVLFYQGHHYHRETIARVAKLSFVVGAHCDDPFGRRDRREYRLLRTAFPEYQGYHVNRQCNVEEAMEYGIKHVRVLKTYYIPWLHHPCQLSAEERDVWGSDVVYAGHSEPDQRAECLARVVRAGLKCKIFGNRAGWKSVLPEDVYGAVRPIHFIKFSDCRKALCGSKIGACFFSKWNRDQYTHRSWEIPACGVFLLSERTPAMQEFYQEGKEAEFFDNADEFIDKARFYVRNDLARMRIAQAGHARVIESGNDIYARMKQWRNDVQEWREE